MKNAVTRSAVIGIGNPSRGDDAAGRAVVRILRDVLPRDVAAIEADGEGASLIAEFEMAQTVYLVDACTSGARPGTIRRFDVSRSVLPQTCFNLSTHSFGLVEAIELARALGRLPARCIVYAIEGQQFEAGAPLSPAVAHAVADVAERLRREFGGRPHTELEQACTKRR